MKFHRLLLVMFTALLISLIFISTASAKKPAKRWIYVGTNLLVKANVDQVVELLNKASKLGYNGMVIADGKFMMWDTLGQEYVENVQKVRDECRKLKMDFIPCVFPNGWANDLLSRNPNLAEGLPVKRGEFIAKDGRLVPVASVPVLVNGNFENFEGNSPAGFSFIDEPGKISFIDTQVKYEGNASMRLQDIDKFSPEYGHGRICQKISFKPFTYYHLSAMVKTENFESANQVRIAILGKDDASLCQTSLSIEKTQDWKRIDVAFNTLDMNEANLYLGVWGGKGGKIWWDDVRIEPAGFVNILRRSGTPLKITDESGQKVYVEGKDYSRIEDPRLGNDPWKGCYSSWHEAPTVTIPEGSAISDGQKIYADYYHPVIIYEGSVTYCMAEPQVYEIYKWQADQVKKYLRPDGYFMSHDEIRAQGWDASCEKSGKTPGQLLARNVKECIGILKKTDPGKPVYVWSDMFDPYHNAQKTGRYYMVKGDGPWYGSWEGLDRDVIVMSWHGFQPGRLDSLKHFAKRGNKQILAGYYDGNPAEISDWLKDAAQVNGVIGVMYTTWQNNYNDIEAFIKAAEQGN